MTNSLDACFDEWNELERDYSKLEDEHKSYYKKVSEVKAVQKQCMSKIAHQRYRIKQIQETIKRCEKGASSEQKEKVRKLQAQIDLRKSQFRDFEEVLPHANGIYLKVILGSVNVSLLSKQDKYIYKEDYERFKLYLTCITLVCACILLFFWYRVTDAAFQFLLVWYYCTLTIREHILKVNGSRIKGWWISHHFISTVGAGIMLIWPDGFSYREFRNQFVIFSIYISLVQLAQYYYQSGLLYRLRALGERRNMDITVEGFQSWMWKGLTFVLPFLILGYLFQLYNAYILYNIAQDVRCIEWHVLVLAGVFLVLFLGNSWTSGLVIKEKIVHGGYMKNIDFVARNKYRFSSRSHLKAERDGVTQAKSDHFDGVTNAMSNDSIAHDKSNDFQN